LNERIKKLLEGAVTVHGDLVLVAGSREDEGPEVDRVDELPVVNGLERILYKHTSSAKLIKRLTRWNPPWIPP
jgi:hypothetical protein